MRIETTSAVLKEIAQTAAKAIDGRSVSAWMNGILLMAEDGKLTATATNGQYTISRSATCFSEEKAEMLVDGKMLSSMAAKLPNGECVLSIGNDSKKVSLRAGTSKTTLALLDVNEFQRGEPIMPTVTANVSAGELKRVIDGVKYAVALTDSRVVMTGILLQIRPNQLFAVGLDGFRMGVCCAACEGSGDAELIVPAKALACVLSAIGSNDATITLASDGQTLTAEGGDVTFRTALLVGTYIDYRKIVPHSERTTVQIQVSAMRDAVERAMLVNSKSSLVKMTVADGVVTVQSNSEAAETVETMELPAQGEPIVIAFNGKYLREMLAVLECERATMKMTTPVAPVLVSPDDGNEELHLVLPVRVQG